MALAASIASEGNIDFGMEFYLEDRFSSVARAVDASMSNLDRASNNYAQSIRNNFQQGFNQIRSGAATVFAGLAIISPVGYALKVAGEFEAINIQIETLLKSKEAADSFFKDLKGDALNLPTLGIKDLSKGAGYLISAGVEAQRARKDLFNLGIATMATGGTRDSFNRMSYNLSQAKNKGKADGMDIKQFSNANIPIAKLVMQATGKNVYNKDVPVTYDDLTKSLELFAEENKGIIEAMKNSISGQAAMMKENFEYFFAAVGNGLKGTFVPFGKAINKILTELTTFAQSSIGQFTIQLLSMGMAFISLSVVAFGFYKIAQGLKTVFSTLRHLIATTLFKNLAGNFIYQFGKMVALSFALFTLLNSNSTALVGLGLALSVFMGPFSIFIAAITVFSRAAAAWNDFTSGKNTNLQGLVGLLTKLGGVFNGIFAVISGLNKEGWEWSLEFQEQLRAAGVLEIVTSIGSVIHSIYSAFIGIANFLGINGEELALWMASFIAIAYIASSIIGIFGGIATIITTVGSAIAAVSGGIALISSGILSFIGALIPAGIAMELAFLPVTAIVLAVSAIVGFVILIIKYWDKLTEKFKDGSFLMYILNPFQIFIDLFTWAFNDLKDWWNGDKGSIGQVEPSTGVQEKYQSGSSSQYMNENGQNMRDIKTYQNTQSSGDYGYQQATPANQEIILNIDGYEIHRAMIPYQQFEEARS